MIAMAERPTKKKLIRRPRNKAGVMRRRPMVRPVDMTREQLQAAICPNCGTLCKAYCTKNYPTGERIQHRQCEKCGTGVKVPIGH